MTWCWWATPAKSAKMQFFAARWGLRDPRASETAASWQGKSGTAGHLEIGDGAIITSQSGMHPDVPPGAVHSGYPVLENKLWLKVIAALKRLPEMQKTLRHLAGEMDRMKSGGK